MTHPQFVPPTTSLPTPSTSPTPAGPPGLPTFAAAETNHASDHATDSVITEPEPLLEPATDNPFASSTQDIPVSSEPDGDAPAEAEPVGEAAPVNEAAIPEAAAEEVAAPEEAAVVEEAQAVIEEAQADIAAAEADLEEAQADLDEAETDLAEADAQLETAEDELAGEAGESDEAVEIVEVVEVVAIYDEDDFEEINQLRPGDIEESIIAVWDPEVAERYRDAWRDIQAHFVDEPEAALSEAQDLVAEAVQALADALIAEQVSIDPHEQDATPDTEAMRIAMRGYRDFLERVLAL